MKRLSLLYMLCVASSLAMVLAVFGWYTHHRGKAGVVEETTIAESGTSVREQWHDRLQEAKKAAAEPFGVDALPGWMVASWPEPGCSGAVVHMEELRSGKKKPRIVFYWYDFNQKRITQELSIAEIEARAGSITEIDYDPRMQWTVFFTTADGRNTYDMGIAGKTWEWAYLEFPAGRCGLRPVLLLRHAINHTERVVELF